jgi:hypothetical protein
MRDEWVPYYHTMLNDHSAKAMIERRLESNHIVEYDGRFGLSQPRSLDQTNHDAEQLSMLVRHANLLTLTFYFIC